MTQIFKALEVSSFSKFYIQQIRFYSTVESIEIELVHDATLECWTKHI